MEPKKINYKLDRKIQVKSEDLIWHLHEYGVDLKSNHIYLMGTDYYQSGVGAENTEEPGVEFTMANRFIKNLNLCMRANPGEPIVIHMKTNGGYWEEGMAIYDAIKACPSQVTILNYTHARSMSSIILQAADKRVMMPHSSFMFHMGTNSVSGTQRGVEANVEWYKNTTEIMVNIYAQKMKDSGDTRTIQGIKKWLITQMEKKEDVFLTAEQAVKAGLADSIFDYDWSSLTKYSE